MALMAPVENGQIVETESQKSLKKQLTASKNGMDKEAFLQLLVAQMQYQDPLEPTSNTEFVSQYAQFSQVEQMQNLAATSELARATSLVGQHVYVKTTGSDGDPKYIYGKVDYVAFENNKAYVAIEESLYSIDDVDTVVDLQYKDAYDKAYDFNERLNKLPKPTNIDLSNAEEIDELEKIYNEMTDYEKSFVASDVVKRLNQYNERLKEIRAAAEEDGKGDETEEGGEESGGDSGKEETEGADKA